MAWLWINRPPEPPGTWKSSDMITVLILTALAVAGCVLLLVVYELYQPLGLP